MRFHHFGKDYSEELQVIPEHELRRLRIESQDQILRSPPVVTECGAPIKIAFFGLSAYCADSDYSEALLQPNFTEWCQSSYNPKLVRVMSLWKEGLRDYINGGALYYSNFSKLVLREGFFKSGKDATKAVRSCGHARIIFKKIAGLELKELRESGCRVVVIFGNDAFSLMEPILPATSATNIKIVHEKHFSRYAGSHTRQLIDSVKNSISYSGAANPATPLT